MESWRHGSKAVSYSSELEPKVTIDPTGNLAVSDKSDRFQLISKLGSGTYGTVFQAHDFQINESVAVKKMVFSADCETGIPVHVIREMSILKALDHPNVIKLLECTGELGKFKLILECMDLDLHSYIKDTKRCLSMDAVKRLVYQLLSGVNHCHVRGIAHRDLKPQNLLIRLNTMTLKISDFGMARHMQTILRAYSPEVVTLYYRAPELLMGCKIYSTAVDIWSVGCILGELILREPLFVGTNEFEMVDRIFHTMGTPDDAEWPGFSSLQNYTQFRKHPKKPLLHTIPALVEDLACAELMNQLLRYCPDTRITGKAALTHPVFSGNF